MVPDDPLLIHLGSDKPIVGSISFDTVFPWGSSQREITPEQITSAGGQPHEVTVIIEPLGQSNPDGRGREIWVHEIASDLEKFDSTNWNSIPLPSSWKHDVRRGAVVFISGQSTPLVVHLKAISSITLRLLRHPWSGQARITVDGISYILDLYASGIREGQFQKKILLSQSLDVTQQIETNLPSTAKDLRLTFTNGPRLMLLKHAEWQSRGVWTWNPDSDIKIGPGVEVLKKDRQGLLLRINASDGWISFQNIQMKPFFMPRKEDLTLMVILCFVWWGALEIYRPRSQLGVLLRSQMPWIKYSLPCAVVWLLYWLAFFPGLMSPDSFDQWNQISKFHFNDHHPAFLTLMWWLITRLWFSPAAIALTQLFAMSGLIGWGLSRFQVLGVSSAVLWVVCGLFALSPVMGAMTITLWKDIFYSISVLWLTLLLLEIIKSRGRWLATSWRNAILLGIVSFFVAIFRHNGPPVALGTILALGVIYRVYWRRLLVVFIITISIYCLVRGPLYQALHVGKASSVFMHSTMLHQVSAVIAAGTPLTQEERNVLDKIMPIDQWKSRYYCAFEGSLIYDSPFDRKAFADNAAAFRRIWRLLVFRNPGAVLRHQVCASNLVWNMVPRYYLYTIEKRLIWPKESGLSMHSQMPSLRNLLNDFIDLTELPKLKWLIWLPATYLYGLLLLTLFTAFRMKKASWLIFALPAALQSATLLLVNIAQDFRYQFPVYLVGLMSVCLPFCRKSETKNRPLKKVR